jgi:uncharacterized membrane protein
MEADSCCSHFKGKVFVITDFSPFLIFFPKYLNFLCDHVSYYFEHKFNPCQHSFNKFESTFTSLVMYIHFIIPLVYASVKLMLFILISAVFLTLVQHALLLHECTNYGLSSDYVNWFIVM